MTKEKEEIIELVNREGDLKEFNIGGIKCTIIRHSSLGNLCGYVDIPKEFPEYGKGYDELNIHCHGGLTYSGQNGKYWRIGFDCGHYGDVSPSMLNIIELPLTQETYKDMAYVEAEIMAIVDQLDSTNYDKLNKRNKFIDENT